MMADFQIEQALFHRRWILIRQSSYLIAGKKSNHSIIFESPQIAIACDGRSAWHVDLRRNDHFTAGSSIGRNRKFNDRLAHLVNENRGVDSSYRVRRKGKFPIKIDEWNVLNLLQLL